MTGPVHKSGKVLILLIALGTPVAWYVCDTMDISLGLGLATWFGVLSLVSFACGFIYWRRLLVVGFLLVLLSVELVALDDTVAFPWWLHWLSVPLLAAAAIVTAYHEIREPQEHSGGMLLGIMKLLPKPDLKEPPPWPVVEAELAREDETVHRADRRASKRRKRRPHRRR